MFSHGWPLSADAWDEQLKLVADHGFRGVAHDRRGHGRSTQTWTGHDMDHYADGLAAVIHGLDLWDVTPAPPQPLAAPGQWLTLSS